MINIKDNIAAVNLQIKQACQLLGKASDKITLLAVSKTKPVALIEQAYQAGQRDFGENYVQEAVEKAGQLSHLNNITWHYIGPIQANKTRLIAEHFAWVHSVDRAKIITRLDEHRSGNHTPLNICLQVNISQESSKSGASIDEIDSLAEQVNNAKNLTLRGLMAIPEKTNAEQSFQQMHQLYQALQAKYPNIDTLSMGMSGDLHLAIANGSTMVRIGTAIFGARQ